MRIIKALSLSIALLVPAAVFAVPSAEHCKDPTCCPDCPDCPDCPHKQAS